MSRDRYDPGYAPRAPVASIPHRLARVMQLLSRLPGVGDKTAQRFALFLATGDERNARELGEELSALREHVRPCDRCGNVAEVASAGEPAVCAVCRDPRRDPALLCVVARVQDLLAIERSGAMRGRYFVLGKLLSPSRASARRTSLWRRSGPASATPPRRWARCWWRPHRRSTARRRRSCSRASSPPRGSK